jgi:hypothetical protein
LRLLDPPGAASQPPGFFVFYRFHHLADIRQASPAFGILRCAVAAPRFFFQGDFFANQRAAVFYIIIFDIPFRKIETVADKVIGFELIFFSTTRRDFNHWVLTRF